QFQIVAVLHGEDLLRRGPQPVALAPVGDRLPGADADVAFVLVPREVGDAVLGEGPTARLVVVRLAVHERSVEIEDDRQGAEGAHGARMPGATGQPSGRSTPPVAAAGAGPAPAAPPPYACAPRPAG